MDAITEGTLLWEPSAEVKAEANLSYYMEWLRNEWGLGFDTYHQLWEWSVTELEAFWQSVWDYFRIQASGQYGAVLAERKMPGADWFAGAELNYAEHLFRSMSSDQPAMIYKAEGQGYAEVSWAQLYRETAAIASSFRELGVERGDRVVAYMPHVPQTITAFLACASLGAVWSSCSPDFGAPSVLDRFQQIEPKVLIAVDGYPWNGKVYDRRQVVAELQASLPTLEQTILVTQTTDGLGGASPKDIMLWDDALATLGSAAPLSFERVPFSHPLWVLYSSGTTGLPKPIVQGQGGILLEHLKALTFQLDLKPQDRFFWYTSTGWMMWNIVTSSLLCGCTAILYNGSPSYPDMNYLWQLAEETGMTYFGTSAAYISACRKAGLEPGRLFDLSRLRAIGSTGSPLSVDGFQWVYEKVSDDLALESISGGTDLCTPFVGGCRLRPVRAGEIQCSYLGAKAESFNEAGESVIDQVGEHVLTEPMPSMPLYFWNDHGARRYRASYFEVFPGVWRHGDWAKLKKNGGWIVYGRSDSTIKRHGIRMGTAEIYQAVERLPEIVDCLVIDMEALGQESYMPMFVVLREGAALDDELIARIQSQIRQDISPRHVPNEIFIIQEVPTTLSGKKMEVPIRKILMGLPPEEAANLDAMRNPESLQFFIDLAQRMQNEPGKSK
jgi:acetoacetyl-CoA synthetase